MDGDDSCVGIKNVTVNEPFFQGHFPHFPVMPGVLIIEGLAQTAGALCVHNLGEDYKPQLVYFMGIDRAKFRKPVLPGDQLHYHVRKIRSRGRAWRFYGEAKVNGQVVAEAEVSAMILDQDDAEASKVHATAIVEPGAELAEDVEIGPFCVVGPTCALAPASSSISHVVGGRPHQHRRAHPHFSVRLASAISRRT